jgi:hypothetical protein
MRILSSSEVTLDQIKVGTHWLSHNDASLVWGITRVFHKDSEVFVEINNINGSFSAQPQKIGKFFDGFKPVTP